METSLETLTMGQYSLVFNSLSFSVAAMIGAFAFFVMGRDLVNQKYRPALVVSSIVVLIAGYHYWRIMGSWQDAYTLQGDQYVASGTPFNDAYRYVDWLLTVPLLLVELVLVMKLPEGKTGPMLAKLIIAAAAMIVLGYPGEVSNDPNTRMVWGILSSVPFFYILYVLWAQLGEAIDQQTEKVATLLRGTRFLLLATWGFYPTAYALGGNTIGAGAGEVILQVGYSFADVFAKAGYGCMIFAIAHAKSQADNNLNNVAHHPRHDASRSA